MLALLLGISFFTQFEESDCKKTVLSQLNLKIEMDAKKFAFCGLLANTKEETLKSLLKVTPAPPHIQPIIQTITTTFQNEDQRKRFNRAMNLVSSKKFSKARNILEDLVNEDPFHSKVLFELLKVYDTMNLHKKIYSFHKKVPGIDPFHAPLHFIVAEAALKLDEIKTVQDLIQPFKDEKKHALQWSSLYAESIFRNGEQLKAIMILRSLDRRNIKINIQLARMLITIRKEIPFAVSLLDIACKKKLSESQEVECKQLKSIANNFET